MSPFLCSAAAIAGIAVAGCTKSDAPRPQVSGNLYASLANPGVRVDTAAARDLISIHRRNNGRGPLRLDPVLQAVAEEQVRIMAAHGGANNAVRSGLAGKLARAGRTHRVALQNVSSGYHTLPEAFSGWRQSKPHNANMLDARVARMGIATAFVPNTKYRVYWALVLTD